MTLKQYSELQRDLGRLESFAHLLKEPNERGGTVTWPYGRIIERISNTIEKLWKEDGKV